MALKLQGLDNVLKNLNKEVQGIENRSLKGLIRGSIIVRRSMEKQMPKIPIDTGNLRSSFFIVSSKGGSHAGSTPSFEGKNKAQLQAGHVSTVSEYKEKIKSGQSSVVLGFSANYALFVHENIGANFKRPGAGAKFCEVALQKNKKNILEAVKKEAKVK